MKVAVELPWSGMNVRASVKLCFLLPHRVPPPGASFGFVQRRNQFSILAWIEWYIVLDRELGFQAID